MDDAAKKELLQIARRAVEAAVRRAKRPEARPVSPELQKRCGAFVTIKNRGRLRGCIGQFVADGRMLEGS